MFCTENGVLNARLIRYYQRIADDRDDFYLGSSAIRLLARCIKHCVLKRLCAIFGTEPDTCC